ncbi:MAG: drug/metabolite transporter (DMT)-like permease [Oceanospirillaceae bacterium]|jgi:drug/metabolite transporter (DMT)-like permease
MIIKHLSYEVQTGQIMLFRNAFALLILTPWLISAGFSVLKTPLLKFHFLRAALGVSAMGCLYYAWGHLPLAQSALLKQTSPFFIPVIAFFWLQEKIAKRVVFAIFVGFSGVYFILNPEEGVINQVVLLALLGAVIGAFAKVTIRKLGKTENSKLIVFYFSLFATLLSVIPAYFSWQAITITNLGYLFALAITSTIAQLLLSKAYRMTKAGVLAPFTYSSVFYAAVLGWVFFAEAVSMQTMIGITLICSAGLLTLKADK